jgi:hypothetical protein
MSTFYDGYEIEPAVYSLPVRKAFIPGAILVSFQGGRKTTKRLTWPDRRCNSREEAERLSIEYARRAIDLGPIN